MTTLPTQEPARSCDSESDVAPIGNNELVNKEKAGGSHLDNSERDREFAGFDPKREAKLLRKMDLFSGCCISCPSSEPEVILATRNLPD